MNEHRATDEPMAPERVRRSRVSTQDPPRRAAAGAAAGAATGPAAPVPHSTARAVKSPNHATLPEFAVALRGYDRAQVEDYVTKQSRWLEAAQARTEAAEEQLAAATGKVEDLRRKLRALEHQNLSSPPPSIEALGERVARILSEAWEAAEELRKEAESDAATARARADELLARTEATARERAAALVQDADRRRQQMLEELEAERAERSALVSRLNDQRQHALGELSRLQAVLQDVLSPSAGGREGSGAGSAPNDRSAPNDTSTIVDLGTARRSSEPALDHGGDPASTTVIEAVTASGDKAGQ
ncbi:MAG: hypothetical protein ACYDH5_05330 [Acidimicrobiales bacterium]